MYNLKYVYILFQLIVIALFVGVVVWMLFKLKNEGYWSGYLEPLYERPAHKGPPIHVETRHDPYKQYCSHSSTGSFV